MIETVLLALLFGVPSAPELKTVGVPAHPRVEIVNEAGEIVVTTGTRSEVQVKSDAPIKIQVSGSVVEIAFAVRARAGEHRRLDVVIPTDASLSIIGWATDIDVTNVSAEVIVNSREGDVAIAGAKGLVSVDTIDGTVQLRETGGRVNVHTVAAKVDVQSAAGDLSVETVSGDIVLGGLKGSVREVATFSGAVTVNGRIEPGTRTAISTHSGAVFANVRGTTDATLTVIAPPRSRITAAGILLQERVLDKFFVERRALLGSGSGVLTVRTFDGSVTFLSATGQ